MKSSKEARDVSSNDRLKDNAGMIGHRFSEYLRVWPMRTQGGRAFAGFTVGKARPWAEGKAGLYELSNEGREYALLADLNTLSAEGLDTTGQPLLYEEEIFVPMWSTKFYTDGFLGLAIVSCNVADPKPEIRYSNHMYTYASHFFRNTSRPDELFLGVGKGGGGRRGKIRVVPDSGVLLKSSDRGKTWRSVFTSEEASAIYDGIAMNDMVIITSRDSGEIHVLKEEPSGTYSIRKTYLLASPARNISLLTWKNSSTIVVSSDNGFYAARFDGESLEIKRISMPIRGFALRYPTIIDNRFLSFIGVSSTLGRSALLLYGAESDLYYVDLTRLTGLRTFSRMALCESSKSEQLLLGTEMEGCLRVCDTKWLLRLRRRVGTKAWFETTVRSLYSFASRRARDALSGIVTRVD